VRDTNLFFFVIAAVVLAVLASRAIARRRPKTQPKVAPGVLRVRALIALRDLSVENNGAFIQAHKVVTRLGQSPGLPMALETLLAEGLTERGSAPDGWSGDRPTAAGYAEAARLDSELRT
jgi:hypothetical protein